MKILKRIVLQDTKKFYYNSTLLITAASIIGMVFSFSGNPASTDNEYTWDISPFGDLRYWSDETGALGKSLTWNNFIEVPQSSANEWNLGVYWNEDRDISHIEITYDGRISESLLKETKIQYWFKRWPGEPPREFTIADHIDDPWQGKWLTAETNFQINGNKVVYTFKPVSKNENELAHNLPDPVSYRRTLKVRILYNSKPLSIQSLKICSPTNDKNLSLRIEFGCDKPEVNLINGKLEIYNGWINKVSGWNWDSQDKLTSKYSWNIQLRKKTKGIIADLKVAAPSLTGSNDLSIVTVLLNNKKFSFLVNDLEKGPIYIPAYSVYISYTSDTISFANSHIRKGQTIREKLKTEPEQTYDRACREIPVLDLMDRMEGVKIYLPLAIDASWQKFGFEWGGNFFMNKRSIKAKGKELARCIWNGDELRWLIGTGKEPVYIRDDKTSHLSVLNDYLPVAEANWNHEGLIFREEGFVTILEGPLSPYGSGRNEQTPAILMVKLNTSNPSPKDKVAHIWLKADSLENPLCQDLFILDRIKGTSFIRAKLIPPEGVSVSDMKMDQNVIHLSFKVPADRSLSMYIYIPFPGDVTESYKGKITMLDYITEKERVISYWRDIVEKFKAYNVPERKFNEMAMSVIPHIRMSTLKDPKSSLFMVPAATFTYPVHANEAAFQIIFLDKIGDHQTAASYLETFLKLQGSEPMPGTFTGNQSAVFSRVKVDQEYNYSLKAFNNPAPGYNLDHGTVLWALGLHYLLSDDSTWFKHALPDILEGARWIIEQRNQTKVKDKQGEPVIHYGLLPAGQLEDNYDWGFWYAVNAYAWLGLNTTVKALKKAGFPQAGNLEKEAKDYLFDLQTSVRRSSELSPVVRLRNNTYIPFVPPKAYQRFMYLGPMKEGYYERYGKNNLLTYLLTAAKEALYGSLTLVTTGVFDPFDPLSEAILDNWEDNVTLSSHVHGVVDDEYWFSRGGMVFQPNLQNPIVAYLLRNEIPAAIRNIYNSMVSCLYRDVNAFAENYQKWGYGGGPMYKIPDEARFVNRVIDMLVMETGKELWLAPGTPKYWLEPGKRIRLYNTTTSFGNLSYELRNGSEQNAIEASINFNSNAIPEKVLLFVRTPFEKPIKSVTVNGKDWKNRDQSKDAIILPNQFQKLEVIVSY